MMQTRVAAKQKGRSKTLLPFCLVKPDTANRPLPAKQASGTSGKINA